MAIRKVVKDTDLGQYMDYGTIQANRLNPILPAINETALATTPTATGNTANRNEFVKDPIGQNWFIDYAGDGLKLGYANGIAYFNSLSAVFPATAQVNTTRVNVTGWTFPVVVGKSYKIEVLATFTTAAATTGGSMGIITSGGALGNIHGYYEADISSGTVATTLRSPLTAVNTNNTTVNSFMTTSGVTAGTSHSFIVSAVFNCTTTGSLAVQWGTEVAGSLAQLRAGSSIVVTMLN